MRILIEIKTKEIPLNYNYIILSLIKNNLSRENPLLFDSYYKSEEYDFRTKPFTYALKLENYKIDKDNDKVDLQERCMLTISTDDYVLGSVIYNSFINSKDFTYKNEYKLTIGKVIMLKERKIVSNEAVFKTMSPIVVRNRKGEFLKIDDENYEKELNYITNEVLKACTGSGLKENLKFEPVMMKKRVIKEEIAKVSKNINKNIFYITGYEGIFKLTGNLEDLNAIYKLGVGFRRSSGFGCLEIV